MSKKNKVKDVIKCELTQLYITEKTKLIVLIQHLYGSIKSYGRKIPISIQIINPFCLCTNSNATINKGVTKDSMFYILGDSPETIEEAKILYRFLVTKLKEGLIKRVVYVKKLEKLNTWFFCENGVCTVITTRELFKELNEYYPGDRDGYTEWEWNNWSTKKLLSHLRYYTNDIDGWILNEDGQIVGAFESKEKWEGHNTENQNHFKMKKKVIESLGIYFVKLVDDIVFSG